MGEILKVTDLNINSRRVNIIVKVVDKGESREVKFKNGTLHNVANAVVGDETGCINMSLWDDQIQMIDVGDVIEIENGYVSTFRGAAQLNVGRYGTIRKIPKKIEVNTKRNISIGDR